MQRLFFWSLSTLSDDIVITKKNQTFHATPVAIHRCRSVSKLPLCYFFLLEFFSCCRSNCLRLIYFYTLLLSYVTFDKLQIKFILGHIVMAITLWIQVQQLQFCVRIHIWICGLQHLRLSKHLYEIYLNHMGTCDFCFKFKPLLLSFLMVAKNSYVWSL